MSNPITSPLQSLLSRAAASLPRETGATSAVSRRLDNAVQATVILCDASASMEEPAWGGRSKIDLLREALCDAWRDQALIAFGATITSLATPAQLPSPAGGTPLHLGLDAAAILRPRHTLVISDGRPDSEADALKSAAPLTGLIDVLYVGPDSDKEAIAFMGKLARAGCGRIVVNDLRRSQRPALAHSIRGLLT